MIAINNIMLFGQRDAINVSDLMPHQNEHERAAASFPEPYIGDSRSPRNNFAHPQRMMKFGASPGPHAPRQLHGRQKASPLRMTVRAQFRLLGKRQEVEPMPKQRQRIAWL